MLKQLAAAAVAGIGLLAFALPAVAQGGGNNRIAIPDEDGGADYVGCYQVEQRLYGPYRMIFCLEQRGTYTVRGGGLDCKGRLDWSADGRDITIELRRSRCGNGVAWTADEIECRGPRLSGGGNNRIAVPDFPSGDLRCTYIPSERFAPRSITARRID